MVIKKFLFSFFLAPVTRYHVHKLIEKYGRQGNLMKWREMLNADCPKRDGRLNDRAT
jgi:hypothetical protein